MKIDVLTLFPEMFEGVFSTSIIKRAIDEGKIDVNYHDIRVFSNDKHNRVDDYPFGGGPGMVIKPGPLYRSIESVKTQKSKVIYVSPKGKLLKQSVANELAKEEHLILLCGHYEGIDQRIIDSCVDEVISIGDYVLTGGEIPAMVMIDSIARLLPGVLSSDVSFEEESHYNGLLEHPQYTRPREFMGMSVPDVLLSGHHKNIEDWKKEESIKLTKKVRPDLLKDENK